MIKYMGKNFVTNLIASIFRSCRLALAKRFFITTKMRQSKKKQGTNIVLEYHFQEYVIEFKFKFLKKTLIVLEQNLL